MLASSPFEKCASCEGLAPKKDAACPHCGAPKEAHATATWTSRAAVAIAGAGFATTLMACYGPPPREYEQVKDGNAPSAAPSASASSMPKAVAPDGDMPKAK